VTYASKNYSEWFWTLLRQSLAKADPALRSTINLIRSCLSRRVAAGTKRLRYLSGMAKAFLFASPGWATKPRDFPGGANGAMLCR
jgi:hypothetical protein